MLLEAPQIWRMKRYNVLETELVYKQARFYRVKVFGGLLGAWKICARERSDRAGGGCGFPPPTLGTF